MSDKKTHFCKVSSGTDTGFIKMSAKEFQESRTQFPDSNVQIFKDENLLEVIKASSYRELILITDDLGDLSEKGLELLRGLYKSIRWNDPDSPFQQLTGAGEVIQLLDKPLYNECLEAIYLLGRIIDQKSNISPRFIIEKKLEEIKI